MPNSVKFEKPCATTFKRHQHLQLKMYKPMMEFGCVHSVIFFFFFEPASSLRVLPRQL